jgi:hypothetical protein
VVIHHVFEARHERIEVGIPWYLGRVDEDLTAPTEPSFLTAVPHRREELAEDRPATPLADAGETRMVWQGFVEVVAQLPADAQAIRRRGHQRSLRTEAFEEHHRIDRVSASAGVVCTHQVADAGPVKLLSEVPIEVVGGHEILERHASDGLKGAWVDPHYHETLPYLEEPIVVPAGRRSSTGWTVFETVRIRSRNPG